jgi:hypothetical protein
LSDITSESFILFHNCQLNISYIVCRYVYNLSAYQISYCRL